MNIYLDFFYFTKKNCYLKTYMYIPAGISSFNNLDKGISLAIKVAISVKIQKKKVLISQR